jgi:excisionase family DNA binding protein
MPSEAVRVYGIARRTIYHWIADGAVPARIVTRGRLRHYQVKRDALEKLAKVRVEELPVEQSPKSEE